MTLHIFRATACLSALLAAGALAGVPSATAQAPAPPAQREAPAQSGAPAQGTGMPDATGESLEVRPMPGSEDPAGGEADAAVEPVSSIEAIAEEPIETRHMLVEMGEYHPEQGLPHGRSLLSMKLQILLDRANASPGVIDGYDGGNTSKALRTFEEMRGLGVDGVLDEEVWAALEPESRPVTVIYTITDEDLSEGFEPMSDDYAELAKRDRLGFTSPEEMFAERFHMDMGLLVGLNEGSDFGRAGTRILVADVQGTPPKGKVVRMRANRTKAELYAYDAEGNLLTAYPATIGSRDTPSPSGTHEVVSIAIDPAYYYRPDTNFQQGENDKALTIPPGPNNPVGTAWIDLSKDTYGIHGTPEPSKIDKTFSHGCVRLTNWDAQELAGLVEPGATVEFIE